MCRTFILNFQLFYGKYLFHTKNVQWWCFLLTLEIWHSWHGTKPVLVYSGSVVCEPGLWNTEWSKCENVDLFVFVCFSNSYNLYFKKLEDGFFRLSNTGWLLKYVFQSLRSNISIEEWWKNIIDDVALIFKNFKFVCQVFNFEELNKVIILKILFNNLSKTRNIFLVADIRSKISFECGR